jgi:hypothetical protein
LNSKNQEINEHDPWVPFLSACAWAIRSTHHAILDAAPGQLVFGPDVLPPVRFKADWACIHQRKQESINAGNLHENTHRIQHELRPGDQALLEKPGKISEMALPRAGRHEVLQAFPGGSARIQHGAAVQTVNMHHLTPFCERSGQLNLAFESLPGKEVLREAHMLTSSSFVIAHHLSM